MENDLISVVVPAYNCAPWLPRCIDSLLAQTYQNMEIIVVDDGSSDSTRDVLQTYTGRIQTVFQDNMGVTKARFAGFHAARGAWIGFVDADDQVEPWMYERLYKNAVSANADISHCGYREDHSDGRSDRPHNTGKIRYQDHMTGVRDLLENTLIGPGLCSKLYKRELFQNLEDKMIPEIRNNEDMLMNYYLFQKAESSVYEDVDPYHYTARELSASRGHLKPYLLMDPILVRKIILKDCSEQLRKTAEDSLVWTTLFSYRTLVISGEKRSEELKILRQQLKAERKYLFSVQIKNAIQLCLVCCCPAVYDMLVRFAFKLLRKNKE